MFKTVCVTFVLQNNLQTVTYIAVCFLFFGMLQIGVCIKSSEDI